MPRYLTKLRRGMTPSVHDDISVNFGHRTKLTEVRDTPIGPIGMSEIIGRDRSLVYVSPVAIDPRGERKVGSPNIGIRLQPKAIAAQLRRLRPQEEERLEVIDAERNRLARERRELLTEAWAKAHKVTAKELREAAEQKEERTRAA